MANKITPSLWFNWNLDEALEFYASVFKEVEVLSKSTHPEAGPGPTGELLAANFRINGQDFIGINAGPAFPFTEAVSFKIDCENQDEVDYYWNSLIAGGGEESQCGWLKDKFGLSWQVVPTRFEELMSDEDPAKANRVAEALFTMRKIVIADLEAAYRGETVGAGAPGE